MAAVVNHAETGVIDSVRCEATVCDLVVVVVVVENSGMFPGASICALEPVQFQLSSFFQLLQLSHLQIIRKEHLFVRLN